MVGRSQFLAALWVQCTYSIETLLSSGDGEKHCTAPKGCLKKKENK